MSAEIKQGQVDLPKLVARIRREFPDFIFGQATLNDRGEDHAVVLLDERWVFRFPRTRAAALRGAQERRLLARLNAVLNIATPKYELISGGGDFGGYRSIPGRELTEARFAAMPRGRQEDVLGQIGAFLGLLHGQSAELVARPGEPARSQEAAWVADRHIARRPRLAAALGPLLLNAADRFYEALPSATATNDAVVIHRDFTDDHILLDPREERLAGVIDFTDASLGDPAFDFSFLWSYGSWAPEYALRHYSTDNSKEQMLVRSLWWFTRYRIDQVWWSVRGERHDKPSEVKETLGRLFHKLCL